MNTKKKLEDEIDFRDLLKNPLRLFGWVFPLFIVILIGLGVYYVKNLSLISLNEQPVSAPDSTNVKKEVLLKLGGISPAVDLAVVKNPTKEFIDKGKGLYDSNCKSCHGDTGMGDGAAGAMLNPKPRNLQTADGWSNGRTIDMLYKTLQEGIVQNGMAAYEFLSPEDRMAIIAYTRTFAQYPEIKDEELSSLDQTYQLSKGTVVPSTIPIANAEKKLVEENQLLVKKVNDAKQFLAVSKTNANVELIMKSAKNVNKVFSSFLNMQNITAEGFALLVAANPINYGFNPVVSRYSKEELTQIYNYLKTVTM
ncbi:MAG: Cytochrome c subfamily [Ignavibacteria bacterium]|nr:MAG: Cytochrome c subfamily [Ignavibacteria bacterium]KAF0159702.1 MAG: Cytochrome c subfamily [Ignavibacteria bacterium]